jgi:hypothetical protein
LDDFEAAEARAESGTWPAPTFLIAWATLEGSAD